MRRFYPRDGEGLAFPFVCKTCGRTAWYRPGELILADAETEVHKDDGSPVARCCLERMQAAVRGGESVGWYWRELLDTATFRFRTIEPWPEGEQ